ncbi:MAG: hypothetical protein SOI66_00145 [Bifidobacterium sp.]|jgi:cytoskeletal protein CcmA (bactofilin family)
MDFVSSHGVIKAGSYNTLVVRGIARCEDGVTFTTLVVHGTVVMRQCSGRGIRCDSGVVVCHGDMTVHEVRGDGELHVGGALRCRRIDFTGVIRSRHGLICMTTMAMRGMIHSTGMVNAERMHIQGPLIADSVHARDIDIRPLHSALLTRHAKEYCETSRARVMTGSHVVARGLVCHSLVATCADLQENCRIRRVTYRTRLTRDSTTTVDLERRDDEAFAAHRRRA